MTKMNSIEHFKNIIVSVRKKAEFQGYDADGNVIVDRNVKYPIVEAYGTEKIHGTNASYCFNNKDGYWAQSKKHKISVQKDNAGFAAFCHKRKDQIENYIKRIISTSDIDPDKYTIGIFGEFAGKGIQKGVAISELDKAWYIFGVKISEIDGDKTYWMSDYIFKHYFNFKIDGDIYNLHYFKTYNVEIDFNRPDIANNVIADLVKQVENESFVAKDLGVSGIGEGIVFRFDFKDTQFWFKAKGDKHSKTTVKKHKKVDDKKIQKCIDVAEKVTPGWRLEQMYNETFDIINGGEPDIKGTGTYIKSVINDIVKEDLDVIINEDLTMGDVQKYISNIAKDYLFEQIDKSVGL